MATLNEVLQMAQELRDLRDRVDELQKQKNGVAAQLTQVTTDLDAAKLLRDAKKAELKTAAATL